jgi:peptidoglycan/xylan/chitin deacetylase (PgdA/CDA1 family)
MIGVIANQTEHEVVQEFFELFKTPWEFARENTRYDVLLCCGEEAGERTARVVVIYSSEAGKRYGDGRVLVYRNHRLPIYGSTHTFSGGNSDLLLDESSGEAAVQLERFANGVQCRVGYDLFGEVRALLTSGQPAANAGIPALELHIALLRELITSCGISLFEIPPVPGGSSFIVCLTHDVDHPSIRRHKLDHTAFGFLYRAIVGSLRDARRGRISLSNLVANWKAALKLPFVYLGLAKDFWLSFADRYLEIEDGVPSTFFVIPFAGRPGKPADAKRNERRAAGYGARDIKGAIDKLQQAGCEVGLHGIDAWTDPSAAREELREIRQVTGRSNVGVRMHWLYFDQNSPGVLEEAGAAYDSTRGYNETIGYRSGTTQIYKPLGASRLLELPMHVMDTALFYPSYLDCSAVAARERLVRMIENAAQMGGCLTINWHDRSIAPQRLWDAPYRELIRELKSRGAWFATAGQAAAWFQKRRSAAFEMDETVPGGMRVVETKSSDNLPALRVRIHKAARTLDEFATTGSERPVSEATPDLLYCN